jgi:nucleoside-diphosphate-sugar epimerase
MDGRSVLLTGITGFIGRHLATRLVDHGCRITAVVRPKADRAHLGVLRDAVTFLECDLSDCEGLRRRLVGHRWEVIFHLGALRGLQAVSNDRYMKVNVDATEVFGQHARHTDALLAFCSSVGVYGAIPRSIPATSATPFHADNCYHYTKIEAERRLQALVPEGLRCAILRPSITYGAGDYGFPYMLVRLIDAGLFFLPLHPGHIHLTDVDMLCDAFLAVGSRPLRSGEACNVVDATPVLLEDLVNFIHDQLKSRPFPRWKRLPVSLFRLGEMAATWFGNHSWKARFQLISRSWSYDSESFLAQLGVKASSTIPTFSKVVAWYRSLRD